LGNALGNMSRYIGKICDKHPELGGERRNGNCPACQRERVRAKPSRDVQRRKVRKWRAANRERYLEGAHARSAVRRARQKGATEGDSAEVRRAWIALSQEAKRQGKVIDHVIPLAGCRVCGAKGPHEPWNWSLITPRDNTRKGNRCDRCWIR
jgi:hypothetical protein